MSELRTEQIPAPIKELCRKLRAAGHEAWLVGGAVRDLLLGRAAHDFDVATSARPPEVTQIFGRRRSIPTGARHGTITVLLADPRTTLPDGAPTSVEVTTFRGDGAYTDGRRPDAVEFVDSLREDLQRRDFSMNAIAFDPLSETLSDPFDGRQDLAQRLIRAVGDPIERFREDGLRPLRAVRFAAQLEFALDPPTEHAIGQTLDVFRKVSAERVRDEVIKILSAPRPSIGLQLMHSTGLLAEVLPELLEGVGVAQNRFHAHDVWHHTLAVVDATVLQPGPSPWLIRMSALLHDIAKPRTAAPKEDAPGEHTFYRHEQVGAAMADGILRRLKLPSREREQIVHLVLNHMFWYSSEWSDGTVRRFIGRVGPEMLPALFALREGDVRGRGQGEDPAAEVAPLKERIAAEFASASALRVSDLAIGGADVMRVLACEPGPIIGEVLRRLLERVLDDAALNTRERLEPLIAEVAQEIAASRR